MYESMDIAFGNPSSTHAYGRKAKVQVEAVRKLIAKEIKVSPADIIFTSGGTEADNAALFLPVRDWGIKRIITAATEHHAVLHAAAETAKTFGIPLEMVALDEKGRPQLDDLESKLRQSGPSLVSLMHGNNETGTMIDLHKTGALVREYDGVFHSDTVQTVGHFKMDLSTLPVDLISCSAHKFYGPKGVGFLYLNPRLKLKSFITGGAQERGRRGGTENTAGIVGLGKAFELAYAYLPEEEKHIRRLKEYLIEQLQNHFPRVLFNGACADAESLYTVVSVRLPEINNDGLLLFNLDLAGIALSGGSACASGSLQTSHVIKALYPQSAEPVLRISLGKDNRKEEIDKLMEVLSQQHS